MAKPLDQNANTQHPTLREQFRQPIYDRKNLSTTLTGHVGFFANQLNAQETLIRYQTIASVAKTKRDTNMPSNGMDPNRDYMISGVSVALIPNYHTVLNTSTTNGIRADKDMIREGGWMNITIVSKSIVDLPLLLIPEINGESGVSTTASGSTIFAGPHFPHPMWNIGDPILLEKGQTLIVDCSWDGSITLGQSYDMMVIFMATVSRSA